MLRIIECCICKKMARANLVLREANICASCEKRLLRTSTVHKDYISYVYNLKRVFTYNYGNIK
ncbi:MAG: hypothetical protein GX352_04245 [Clostridiales bacterium]|nr:hypothetical protein [Clostridiales bacterium]